MVERTMMKPRTSTTGLGGLDLVEEAVQALRLAPPGALLCYYVGTAPFVLAALFFWSDMSRSGLAAQHLFPAALGLSLLFAWMKLWQSVFTWKLSSFIAKEPLPRLDSLQTMRALASQTVIHSTALVVIPVSVIILLPLAWVIAFYQSVTVLGLRQASTTALLKHSWTQARLSPMQNHGALLVLKPFALFILLNVAVTMLTLPFLLKILVGVETNFTLSLGSSLNTTFLMAALGVTYLCFDPLLKATYAVRCFYGEARTTGADLRVSLRACRASMPAVVGLLILAGMPCFGAAEVNTKTAVPASSEKGAALNRSIDDVLKRPEYAWRAPRLKPEFHDQGASPWNKRVREWLRRSAKSLRDWVENLMRSKTPPAGPSRFSLSAEGLVYILTALVVVILGFLLWLVWRTRARSAAGELQATPASALPDLESNNVAGDELPVDGWTNLGLELLERGEFRLAMRAFYLSSLAHLAARDLVKIEKFKSNRDYERELARRSHALPDITRNFSANVSVFDRVWYGRHAIDGELIQEFRRSVERIKEC